MRRLKAGWLVLLVTAAGQVAAGDGYPPALVSYDDYKRLVAEVEPHRASRLVDLDTFLDMSRGPDVIVLDARPAYRYQRLHIQGARNLAFADFTRDTLRQIIPSFDTTILIYCNNNFAGSPPDFPSKVVLPVLAPDMASAPADQSAPTMMMALNVPTYINLYGYGYRNVYELDELVAMDDPRITFAGSVVDAGLLPGSELPR